MKRIKRKERKQQKRISRKPVLVALRGATCCRNDAEDMQLQVGALYDELLHQNRLREQDLVSLIFSVTEDLDVDNPASVLRRLGRVQGAALFVVQEAAVQGGMRSVVRLLVHAYLPQGAKPCHIYRNGAQTLRPTGGFKFRNWPRG
ncbi:MAG: chorismate mutase [Treponema sp.]|jgi:chorismate mutase|nr:chorismate mutase [Treponema sp.]